MGNIARENTAPIRDGEKIIASDVENEFSKIFAEQNALLDTTNLARSANILGTQFANTTIAAGNFSDDTITTASMAESAVPRAAFSVEENSGDLTNSTSLVDVPGLSSLTITPGSTSDIVTMGLFVSLRQNSALTTHNFGFNIDDGTGDVEVGTVDYRYGATTTAALCFLFQHTMTASAAAATVYIARYKRVVLVGSDLPAWYEVIGVLDYNTIFYVFSTPIK